MSKYTGSKWKKSRRLGFSTLESGVELKKRSYGPGQHGQDRKRKPSQYGAQLLEKQKLRELYGVNERQFRRLFLIAKKEKTVTGLAFFRILESRLDNLVFRMGFARTRAAARQLVNHGHVTVNGKKVDIPSYLCKVGDVIAFKEDQPLKVVKELIENDAITPAPYTSVDKTKYQGTFARLPERNELPREINEAQIIEYYNRLL